MAHYDNVHDSQNNILGINNLKYSIEMYRENFNHIDFKICDTFQLYICHKAYAEKEE